MLIGYQEADTRIEKMMKTESPEVMRLFKRLTLLFRDRLEDACQPLGVTAAQLQVLAALSEAPGSSGAQVSRYCKVTPQTTHALLAAAEERGWTRRTPHPENVHTLLSTLTPEGRRVFARGRTIARRLQRQMLCTLSTDDVEQLRVLLEEMIGNLE